jgi:hypothetical protein
MSSVEVSIDVPAQVVVPSYMDWREMEVEPFFYATRIAVEHGDVSVPIIYAMAIEEFLKLDNVKAGIGYARKYDIDVAFQHSDPSWVIRVRHGD